MRIIHIISICAISLIVTNCNNPKKSDTNFPGRDAALKLVNPDDFISEIDGKQTELYTIENKNGIILRLTNFGASMVQVIAPDKDGNFKDIILGYANIEGYVNDNMNHGCTVGRYANRIGKGKFTLNGKEYNLTINNGENTLHGGPNGIHSKVWDAVEIENGMRFTVVSPDMEEGYPGELTVVVSYTLNDQNEISINYEATTTDSTFINLTNHSYWNLNGEAETSILDHDLQIMADYITPVDEGLIPTGELMDVTGTPFDFRKMTRVGERIDDQHPQIIFGGGYDHNFVLSMEVRPQPELAAVLYSPESGRTVEFLTTEPGIQVYTGNFMDGSVSGKNGKPYNYRYAIALETQHFPDSPNKPEFPSTLLVPGQQYTQTTIVRLGLKE